MGSVLVGFHVVSREMNEHIIFHLSSGDDTLISFNTNLNHLRYLHCLFFCFEAVSVLEINLAKSNLLPIGPVDNEIHLASIFGFFVSSSPLKYLDLPLGASFKTVYIDGILEKMECRLAGWKQMYLCMLGRTSLIKITLLISATYFMSLSLSCWYCKSRFEKLQDFL